MSRRKTRMTVGAVVAAAAVVAGGSGVLAGGTAARSTGPDHAYGEANPLADAGAAVQVVKTASGTTKFVLQVHGVDAAAGTTFGAHVHQNPCGVSGADAGPHYQHVGAPGSLEDREVWLDFTVNAAGNGHAQTTRSWTIDDTSPRSVIIHQLPTAPDGAAGPRLACIDLDGR